MSEHLLQWVVGDLSGTARIWTALAPALLLCTYFFGGLALYVVKVLRTGEHFDAEMEDRSRSILTGLWIRRYFAWVMQPVWALLLRTGIPPNAVTTLSVLLATGSGVALAAGRFTLGGWLYIFAGICDFLDGRLARQRGESSLQGAALDSILDRYSDAAVLVGLAWYYRDSWVLIAVLLAIVGSSLVPYIRARGEAAGIQVTVGLMQRAERIVYLGAAVAFSPILEVLLDPQNPRPVHRLAVWGVLLLAVSTQITALQRLIYLLGKLGDGPPAFRPWGGQAWRSVISAAVATGLDFAFVNALVNTGLPAPVATGAGCLLGGVANYTLNRMWTFDSQGRRMPQVARYTFVSLTSALLNTGGVALLLLLPSVHYRLAWLLVRVAIFVAWNFPLQRDYVFAPHAVDER